MEDESTVEIHAIKKSSTNWVQSNKLHHISGIECYEI